MADRGRLRLDPTACDGVGLCAHVAAALIGVDSWGFPVLDDRPLTEQTVGQARAAVRACPHKALFIDDVERDGGRAAGR